MSNTNVVLEVPVLSEMCHQIICKLGTDHSYAYQMLDYFYDNAVVKQWLCKPVQLNSFDKKETYKEAIDEWFNEELAFISDLYAICKSGKAKDVIIDSRRYNAMVHYLDERESHLYNFHTALRIKLHNQINTKVFWKVVKVPNFNDCHKFVHGEYYG